LEGLCPRSHRSPRFAPASYTRGEQILQEEVCAENNQHLFDYNIPEAETPDF
jgi:hypothetical protein